MLKLSPQFYIYTFQFNHTVSEFQLIADCFARLYTCNLISQGHFLYAIIICVSGRHFFLLGTVANG